MVICLKQDADLHMAQLMPLPLSGSCFSKIQIGFTFLVQAHLGSPGKRAFKRACVCVCVLSYRGRLPPSPPSSCGSVTAHVVTSLWLASYMVCHMSFIGCLPGERLRKRTVIFSLKPKLRANRTALSLETKSFSGKVKSPTVCVWHGRCVGRLLSDGQGGQSRCWLHSVSVRAMTDAEKRALDSLIAASDAALQQLITTNAEM